jgi:hypothetical protein
MLEILAEYLGLDEDDDLYRAGWDWIGHAAASSGGANQWNLDARQAKQ